MRRFGPELILWFGPPQGFGVDVAADPGLARVPLVAFMGQNRAMPAFEQAATRRRGASAGLPVGAAAGGGARVPAGGAGGRQHA
ncbi:MAG: hypothetical protein H6705_18050 [Myxococcales bacterium]|nr:hypothetical protein [Myxococcales bacterium]